MNSKQREALEEAYNLLNNIDFDEDSDLDDMAAPIVQKIAEALAKHPRNCDGFRDHEEAWRAYKRIVPNGAYFDSMTLWDFIKWLFDETKGECNERK